MIELMRNRKAEATDAPSTPPELEIDIHHIDVCIGMLRQWLNEECIKDAKKFVTNEDLHHWLDDGLAQQRAEAVEEAMAAYQKELMADYESDIVEARAEATSKELKRLYKLANKYGLINISSYVRGRLKELTPNQENKK